MAARSNYESWYEKDDLRHCAYDHWCWHVHPRLIFLNSDLNTENRILSFSRKRLKDQKAL